MTAAKPGTTAEQIDRFHTACGRMIRAWAGLEAVLVMYLRELLGADEMRARIVWTTIGTLTERLELLRRLARAYLEDDALTRLSTYLNQIQSLSDRRDLVAEAPGGLDLRTGIAVFTAETRGGMPSKPAFPVQHKVRIEEIEQWAGQLGQLESELVRALRTLSAAVRGSPRRVV